MKQVFGSHAVGIYCIELHDLLLVPPILPLVLYNHFHGYSFVARLCPVKPENGARYCFLLKHHFDALFLITVH